MPEELLRHKNVIQDFSLAVLVPVLLPIVRPVKKVFTAGTLRQVFNVPLELIVRFSPLMNLRFPMRESTLSLVIQLRYLVRMEVSSLQQLERAHVSLAQPENNARLPGWLIQTHVKRDLTVVKQV